MILFDAYLLYAAAWLSFGIGHSLLASARAKDLLEPVLGPYYRATYNLFAIFHIGAVLWVGYFVFDGHLPFSKTPSFEFAQWGLTIIGSLLLLVALRSYDLGRLAGTSQIRNHRAGLSEPEDEPLNIAGLHAYMRHPIYAGAYLILWGRALDDLGLATAIWGSFYLAIGTFFEERRLMSLYGEAYQAYRLKVPVFIPWRGKVG